MRDPTQSLGLRRAGRGLVTQRVAALQRRLREALQEHDLLGLRPHSYAEPDAARLARGEELVGRVVAETLTSPWLGGMVGQAVRRGLGQVGEELDGLVPGLDPGATTRFQARAAEVEATGVADETRRRLVRALATAIETRATPEALMREVRQVLHAVTRHRLNLVVNTTVVRAVNAGKLFGYRAHGITRVGIAPEWLPHRRHAVVLHDRAKASRAGPRVDIETAEDDRVCEPCLRAAAAGPYTLDEAAGLLPLHAGCRCAVMGWSD